MFTLAPTTTTIWLPSVENLSHLLYHASHRVGDTLSYITRKIASYYLDYIVCWVTWQPGCCWAMDYKVVFVRNGIDVSLMNIRHRLEKSSGTKYTDNNISPEMKALNKKFGIAHGTLFIINAHERGIKLAEFGLFHCGYRSGCVRCRYHSIDQKITQVSVNTFVINSIISMVSRSNTAKLLR
jgi:hypothetical protein